MTVAMLFTGQGSQFAGMGKAIAEAFPAARAAFAEADAALGEPLSRLCFEGPEDQLALTENTQPATLVVSLAAYRALGVQPELAAGHSLGEYTALCAAGALELGDALRLVRERARRMQAAVPPGAGGMVVLRKVSRTEVEDLVAGITRGVCEIANWNAPGQYVVSGETAALDEMIERAGPRRAMKLAVSVPFHCSLLAPAAQGFARVLDQVEIGDPAFAIYCNVDARPVTTGDSARDALARQFAGAVQWEATVQRMLQDEGVRCFVECGPKPVLARLVTQIANALEIAGVESMAATTPDEIAAVRRALGSA